MYQSFVPKPRSFLFAEFGDFAQQTLLDFSLHLDTVELLVRLQFFTSSPPLAASKSLGSDSRGPLHTCHYDSDWIDGHWPIRPASAPG